MFYLLYECILWYQGEDHIAQSSRPEVCRVHVQLHQCITEYLTSFRWINKMLWIFSVAFVCHGCPSRWCPHSWADPSRIWHCCMMKRISWSSCVYLFAYVGKLLTVWTYLPHLLPQILVKDSRLSHAHSYHLLLCIEDSVKTTSLNLIFFEFELPKTALSACLLG